MAILPSTPPEGVRGAYILQQEPEGEHEESAYPSCTGTQRDARRRTSGKPKIDRPGHLPIPKGDGIAAFPTIARIMLSS